MIHSHGILAMFLQLQIIFSVKLDSKEIVACNWVKIRHTQPM